MSRRFVRPREAVSSDRQAATRETTGALSPDNCAKTWKPRSSFSFAFSCSCSCSFSFFLLIGFGPGLGGNEREFRFQREAVIQENAHMPRPAEISLRDVRSTDRQHR